MDEHHSGNPTAEFTALRYGDTCRLSETVIDLEATFWFLPPSDPCSHLSVHVYLFWLSRIIYDELRHQRSLNILSGHTVGKTSHRNPPLKRNHSQSFIGRVWTGRRPQNNTGAMLCLVGTHSVLIALLSDQVCSRMDGQPLPREGKGASLHLHPPNGADTAG